MLNSLNTSAQDMFASDYRVYIEGVQIPFESAHISNVFGELPTATVTLPPWPGLNEMGRNYAPKIHIFWRDYNYAVTTGEVSKVGDASTLENAKRDAYKQIFSGIVTGVSDSKEISPEGGGQQVTLNCSHHLVVLNDILLRFANQHITAAEAQLDPYAEGSIQSSQWDLNTMMLKAMIGITDTTDEKIISHIPAGKLDDLKGTPGIIRVLWNILKWDSRRTQEGDADSEALTDMFIPLVESGIKFWEKMAGHPSIEAGIQSDRVPYKEEIETKNGIEAEVSGDVMVPGAFRTFIGGAAQKELSVAAMNSVMAGMGTPEAIDFMSVVQMTLQKLEYEMAVLASPISKTDGKAIEYIVKPVLPYYYAPICNVVLPNMISNISVSSNFGALPTRTVNLNNFTSLVTGTHSGGVPFQQYTAPHSVRYARAGGPGGDLKASLNANNNKVGVYEWGAGIKSKTYHLPPIYNVLQSNLDKIEREEGEDTTVIGASGKAIAEAAWNKLYPEARWPGATGYNPLSDAAGVSGFQRLNFLYSDHDFAMETAKVRTATAAGCFNPYAIVGYPMDLVDPVPSRESYHGMCTSVSHTIHAAGTAATSYSISAVSSFSELALYNLPAVNPYLVSVFDMQEDMRIYGNPKAYAKACVIYQEMFGVGAAEPALLQEYDTGTVIPFTRDNGGNWTTSEADTSSLYNTQQGSLALVARNIQSLIEVEADTGNSFIDIAHWADVTEENIKVVDNVMRVDFAPSTGKVSTLALDAESSPLVTYGAQTLNL